MDHPRHIRRPARRAVNCKGWHQEAALRYLMNNLDPDVAERPDELIVYGGAGRPPATGRSTRFVRESGLRKRRDVTGPVG